MTSNRRLGAVIVTLVMVGCFVAWGFIVNSASASVGSSASCDNKGVHDESQTNKWHVFWSKNVRVTERMCTKMHTACCTNYYWITYLGTPAVTYPSAWIIPSAEVVKSTHAPFVVSKRYSGDKENRLIGVTWGWSAESCTVVCTDWEFRYRVNTQYTQICVLGGGCDKRDYW